ncbi:hypothetical protein CYMTET_28955, partial [Cymbomonas tetramitiformis]
HQGDALHSKDFFTSRREVRAVAVDPGSWNSLQPVLVEALQDGALVKVFLGGASAQAFVAGKIPSTSIGAMEVWLDASLRSEDPRFREREGGYILLEDFVSQPHQATIVGASSSAVARALSQFVAPASMRSLPPGPPTAQQRSAEFSRFHDNFTGTEITRRAICSSRAATGVVEDRYSTALAALVEATAECPPAAQSTVVYVADSLAKEIIDTHSTFRGDVAVMGALMGDVAVMGAPMYDAVVRAQTETEGGQRRLEVRRELGISQEALVVLIAGQPVATSEILQLVLDTLLLERINNILPRQVRILLRPHPRTLPDEESKTESVLATAPEEFFDADTTAAVLRASSESLVPAADIVISGYSTTNYYAILWQVPAVVYAAIPTLMNKFQKDKHLAQVPEVAAGAAWSVAQPTDLGHVVQDVLSTRPSQEAEAIQRAQVALCKFHDGHAARRVWYDISLRKSVYL